MSNDHYEMSIVKIDGIDFDFCCHISGRIAFNTMCDFSLNNLYIRTDGEIRTRVDTKYNVDDILDHIKAWKLIDINDYEVMKRYLKPTYDLKYYIAKKAERMKR